MRIEAAAEQDFAFGVEPCSPLVVAATVTGHLSLRVEFADGLKGDVQFLPSHFCGVFEALQDPVFFSKVGVEHDAVTWPGELDMAPDAIYEALKRSDVWILR